MATKRMIEDVADGDDQHMSCAACLAWAAALGEAAPGQVIEDSHAAVVGMVRSRRVHSSNVTFLELVDVEQAAAAPALQVCVNRARCGGSDVALGLLDVGDTVCCAGPAGRTRTGRADEWSLFPRSVRLVRAAREPAHILRVLAAWRGGEFGDEETCAVLGVELALLRAMLPTLAPGIDDHRAQQEAQRAARGAADGTAGAARRAQPARLERVREVCAGRQGGLMLVMEHPTHVGNVGAMLRTCDAFGVAAAALVHHEEGAAAGGGAARLALDAAHLRAASKSADAWVELLHFEGSAACLAWLRERGYASVGTALHATRSTALHGASLQQPRLALWVGNEARGLSTAAIDGCDALVHVPMVGMVESLNVAACAAVGLAEIVRQRAACAAATGRFFAPSEDEAARTFERLSAANSRATELARGNG